VKFVSRVKGGKKKGSAVWFSANLEKEWKKDMDFWNHVKPESLNSFVVLLRGKGGEKKVKHEKKQTRKERGKIATLAGFVSDRTEFPHPQIKKKKKRKRPAPFWPRFWGGKEGGRRRGRRIRLLCAWDSVLRLPANLATLTVERRKRKVLDSTLWLPGEKRRVRNLLSTLLEPLTQKAEQSQQAHSTAKREGRRNRKPALCPDSR